jgi:ATP-dependent Lon protease
MRSHGASRRQNVVRRDPPPAGAFRLIAGRAVLIEKALSVDRSGLVNRETSLAVFLTHNGKRMKQLPIYDAFELAQQLARLGQDSDVTAVLEQPTPEGERARFLRQVLFDKRGPDRDLVEADAEMITRLQQLADIAPNFTAAIGVVIRAARLSLQTRRPLVIPPLLLVGPPGAGKTFFARSCAKAIATRYAEVSMNLADDAGAIVGHSLSWRGARPGLVARTLLEGPSAAPVILIDEIDKAGWRVQGDPTDVLLSLLEPENAQAFVDAYIEAPIRADHIQWLCTANDTAMLRTSLLDRLLVAPIEPPTAEQRATVVRSIYARIANAYTGEFAADIGDDVVEALADAPPRQARRVIQLALGFAAEAHRRHLTPHDVRQASKQLNAGQQKPSFGFRPSR